MEPELQEEERAGEPAEPGEQPPDQHAEQQVEYGTPDPILHNDRVFIQGKTRSGKSVLARHIFEHMTGCRRTLIDVKGMWNLGVEAAQSPEQLDLAAPLSHYIPSTLADDEYDEVFRRLWFAGGPRYIWLDESFGPTRAGFASQYLRLIIQQGAQHQIGLAACSQRGVNVEATLRTEAEHYIIFVPRPSLIDLKTIAPDIGTDPNQLAELLNGLQAQEGLHSHLWYCRRQDQFYSCAPLDPAWAQL